MANFTAGTSFSDGVTNDVTAAKLNALVADAVPTSNLSLNSTTGTIATLNSTTGTITTGVIPTLTSTTLITTGTGTAASPAIVPTGDTNTGIFFPAADTIAFSKGGVEAMRIDSSGNVGIGQTPINSRKLIISTTGQADLSIVAGSTSYGQLLFGYTGADNKGIVAYSNTDNSMEFHTNSTERLRIDSSGNVGIGTTSPSQKLTVFSDDVLGGVLVTGSNNPCIRLNDTTDGTSYSAVFAENGGVLYLSADSLNTAANSSMRFEVDQTERLRIDSSGNVGIGTTSPSAQLELSTDSAKKPSTNTWTIASDQRLKTNITNADNDRCYEIVKQVPLKRYTWKSEVYSEGQVKDRSKLGWIAQDVEAVFPKAVGTNRFAYNQVFEDVVTPELDSDGNAVLDENGVAKTKTEKRLVSEDVIEDCKDLNSDQIYAAMYGTIQKLIEKVETLEAKVAALEAA